jgi:hypothetical protein
VKQNAKNAKNAKQNAENAKKNAKNAEQNAKNAKKNAKNAKQNAKNAKQNAKNANAWSPHAYVRVRTYPAAWKMCGVHMRTYALDRVRHTGDTLPVRTRTHA